MKFREKNPSEFFSFESRDQWILMLKKKFSSPLLYSRNRWNVFFLSLSLDDYERKKNSIFSLSTLKLTKKYILFSFSPKDHGQKNLFFTLSWKSWTKKEQIFFKKEKKQIFLRRSSRKREICPWSSITQRQKKNKIISSMRKREKKNFFLGDLQETEENKIFYPVIFMRQRETKKRILFFSVIFKWEREKKKFVPPWSLRERQQKNFSFVFSK